MKQLCLLLVLACLVGKSVQFCYWQIFNEGSETECVGGDGTRIAIGASHVKLNTECVKCSCRGRVGSLSMSCCGNTGANFGSYWLYSFRSCNLPPAIETGRYTRPKNPVNNRMCKYCTSNEVDDEIHLLINCEYFDDLRYNLFLLASNGNSFFEQYTSEQKLIYLMTADHLQIKVASCLQKMMTRRKVM